MAAGIPEGATALHLVIGYLCSIATIYASIIVAQRSNDDASVYILFGAGVGLFMLFLGLNISAGLFPAAGA